MATSVVVNSLPFAFLWNPGRVARRSLHGLPAATSPVNWIRATVSMQCAPVQRWFSAAKQLMTENGSTRDESARAVYVPLPAATDYLDARASPGVTTR